MRLDGEERGAVFPSAREYFLGSPGARIYNIPFKIHATFNKAVPFRKRTRTFSLCQAIQSDSETPDVFETSYLSANSETILPLPKSFSEAYFFNCN